MERVHLLRSSWLHYCSIPYVFVFGQEDLPCEYEVDLSANMMLVKSGDGYDHLSHKVKAGIAAALKIYNPEYILKCDDDIFANPAYIKEYVKICLKQEIMYHGARVFYENGVKSCFGADKFLLEKNKQPYIYEQDLNYASGPMYFLSKKSCQIIAEHMDPEACKFEDTNVGLTLKSHGILLDLDNNMRRFIYTDFLPLFLENCSIAWHDRNHHTFIKDGIISQTSRINKWNNGIPEYEIV